MANKANSVNVNIKMYKIDYIKMYTYSSFIYSLSLYEFPVIDTTVAWCNSLSIIAEAIFLS